MTTFEMISTVEEGVLFAKDVGTISSWRVIPWWYLFFLTENDRLAVSII